MGVSGAGGPGRRTHPQEKFGPDDKFGVDTHLKIRDSNLKAGKNNGSTPRTPFH